MADLARLLLEIEAKGDYARARQLIAEMGTPPPAMRSRIDELKDIPVDVDPYYTLFEKR